MAVLGDHKTIGAGFRNAAELHRVTYDFAVDGGAVADYDVFTASNAMLVELVTIDCKTAITATATANLDLGKGAGGVEYLSDYDIGAGVLVDVQIPSATVGKIVELAAGEKIVMGLETEVITAGKLEFLFRIYSR